jgi:hypothetical protein
MAVKFQLASAQLPLILVKVAVSGKERAAHRYGNS